MNSGTQNLIVLQIRVLAALILRETRATFGNSQIGYVWAIITPAASIAVLVTIFSMIGRQPPFGSSLALFFATGILTLEFYIKLSATLINAFDANRALLTYPLIRETDALFARLILISCTYLLIMLLFFGGLVALGLANMPHRPEIVIQAFLVTAALGMGVGTINAVIMSFWDAWHHIDKVLNRPLLFISGVFYVPSLLPLEATAILEWNPLLHLVEWVRVGYYANYESPVFVPAYPVSIALVTCALGLLAERLFRKNRAAR